MIGIPHSSTFLSYCITSFYVATAKTIPEEENRDDTICTAGCIAGIVVVIVAGKQESEYHTLYNI